MYGIAKMTHWRGKALASLQPDELVEFRKEMERKAIQRVPAPAMPQEAFDPAKHMSRSKRGLRGK